MKHAARSLAVALTSLALEGASPSLEPVASVAKVADQASAFRGGRVTCEQGPLRVTEMELQDGYLKPRPRSGRRHHEFYFARGMYSEGGRYGMFGYGGDWLGDGGPGWSIDYPSADRHMMIVAARLSNLDACDWGQPISLADPDLRRFPFLYSLEWGRNADLSEAEISGLRSYLDAGGLLMLDDFWGSREWANVEHQLRRVFPDRPIVDMPEDHVFFRAHYTIDEELIQVPGFGGGIYGRETFQRDGYDPILKAIFDDEGRIMVIVFGNTDLGDALEHAEHPQYPLRFSTYASELFLNTIMYAMTY
jgi:hypothetical protein